jgi:hypothetical protein
MNDTVITAAIIAVIAPAIMAFITNYFRHQEKKEDWAREDEVARRAEEARKAVVEVAKVAEAATIATTEALTNMKVVVDQTHLLVNSNMMKEMRKGLVSLKAQLAQAELIVGLNKKLGIETPENGGTALELLKSEISASELALVDLEKRTAQAAEVAEE